MSDEDRDRDIVWLHEEKVGASFNFQMGRYAFDNITNVVWWENMQYVLDEVEHAICFR
jgi:hypothetical protein